MSTKVYTGFMVNPRLSQEEVERRFQLVRASVLREADRLHSRFLAETMAELFTARQLNLPLPSTFDADACKYGGSLLSVAGSHLMEERRKHEAEGSRYPGHDLDCGWTLYRIETKNGPRTLCYLSTEQPTMVRIFRKLAPVREYQYWNNSDRPDNVSQRSWDERGDHWGSIHKVGGWTMTAVGKWTPLARGIEPNRRGLFVGNFNRRFTCKARARRVAINLVENQACTVVKIAHTLAGKGAPAMHDYSRGWSKGRDWMRSPEGQKEIACDARAIARHLKPLNAADLAADLSFPEDDRDCPVILR